MGWIRRRDGRVGGIDVRVFDQAAAAAGFVMDPSQRAAAGRLAAPRGRGCYLWGPPGRGKTWLLDTFGAARGEGVHRVHLHSFFVDLHAAIAGTGGSLDAALDGLLDGVTVLCFDEFHVHDIADALFLHRLVLRLLDRRVEVVLTSNYPPDDLLPNPLWHARFQPTIDLIHQSYHVVEVDGRRDYRATAHGVGFAAGRWSVTLPGEGAPREAARILRPAGRALTAVAAGDDGVWFSFTGICDAPSAPVDYLALAQQSSRWTISDIPAMQSVGRLAAQRFSNLVDVLYDRDVTTEFRSLVPLADLGAVGGSTLDEARLTSRLAALRQG